MLAFIRNLVGVKTDQAVNSAIEAIVRWDPKSATEAELRTMEQHLDRLGMQVAEARQAYEKEAREAQAIQQLSDQRMAAAEVLQRQSAAETDPARKSGIEQSLATLLNMLEEMAPEVDREKQDAVDAKEFVDMLQGAYDQAGQKLRTARDALNRAQRDMTRAGQQREIAEQRAEAAQQQRLADAAQGAGERNHGVIVQPAEGQHDRHRQHRAGQRIAEVGNTPPSAPPGSATGAGRRPAAAPRPPSAAPPGRPGRGCAGSARRNAHPGRSGPSARPTPAAAAVG